MKKVVEFWIVVEFGFPMGITISAIALKICDITAGIKKYQLIIKKKKKKHDKIVLLGKSKLNSIGVLISKVLIDLNITDDEFVLINNALQKNLCYEGRNKKFQ